MEPSRNIDVMRYVRLVHAKRTLFTATAVAIMAAMAVLSYTMKPVYEAKTVVLIERNFVNQLIKDITVTPSLEDRVQVLSLVMKSRALLLKVIEALGQGAGRSAGELEGLVKYYQDATEITIDFNKANRRDMDSFAVTFRSSDPVAAATYVNTLVRLYIEENLRASREEMYGASRFVSEQLDQVKAKIHGVEKEIQTAKGSSEGEKEITGTAAQDRLLALQRRHRELLVVYTNDHPDVMKVKNEIVELQAQARRERAAAGTDTPKTTHDPAKLSDLERELEAYKKIYAELIATLGKSEVSTQAEVQAKAGTFRVIDLAIPPSRPMSPNRVRLLLFGILAGIAGGIGIVVLRDFLDDTVRTVECLKGYGLPVLAVIPSILKGAEAVRQRRTALLVYGAGVIAVAGMLSLMTRELFW